MVKAARKETPDAPAEDNVCTPVLTEDDLPAEEQAAAESNAAEAVVTPAAASRPEAPARPPGEKPVLVRPTFTGRHSIGGVTFDFVEGTDQKVPPHVKRILLKRGKTLI